MFVVGAYKIAKEERQIDAFREAGQLRVRENSCVDKIFDSSIS